MDGDGTLQHFIGNTCVHDIQDAVDHLVATGAEDRGAENPACLRINHDLHEALRLIFFDSAVHAAHGTPADQEWAAARVRLSHSDVRFHRHPWPQEVLRVLSFIEHDFDGDSLHHLDVVTRGILRRQQAVERSGSGSDV